jgi:hypothetical protein
MVHSRITFRRADIGFEGFAVFDERHEIEK